MVKRLTTNFGRAVALSSDGMTLAVGSPGLYAESAIAGYVSVFKYDDDNPSSSGWTQLGSTISGDEVGD